MTKRTALVDPESQYSRWKAKFDRDMSRAARPTTPFDAYVWFAREWNRDLWESRQYDDPWKSDLWEFTRLVKAHPDVGAINAIDATRAVEAVISRWGDENGDVSDDPWLDWFESDHCTDPKMEFTDNWDKIRYVPGYGPLHLAIERAKQHPLTTEPLFPSYSAGYNRFISIAAHLQALMGPDRSIMLPCHKLGAMLGTDAMTISRYRQAAVRDGLMTVVKEHLYRPRGKGEATEFSVRADLWAPTKKLLGP